MLTVQGTYSRSVPHFNIDAKDSNQGASQLVDEGGLNTTSETEERIPKRVRTTQPHQLFRHPIRFDISYEKHWSANLLSGIPDRPEPVRLSGVFSYPKQTPDASVAPIDARLQAAGLSQTETPPPLGSEQVVVNVRPYVPVPDDGWRDGVTTHLPARDDGGRTSADDGLATHVAISDDDDTTTHEPIPNHDDTTTHEPIPNHDDTTTHEPIPNHDDTTTHEPDPNDDGRTPNEDGMATHVLNSMADQGKKVFGRKWPAVRAEVAPHVTSRTIPGALGGATTTIDLKSVRGGKVVLGASLNTMRDFIYVRDPEAPKDDPRPTSEFYSGGQRILTAGASRTEARNYSGLVQYSLDVAPINPVVNLSVLGRIDGGIGKETAYTRTDNSATGLLFRRKLFAKTKVGMATVTAEMTAGRARATGTAKVTFTTHEPDENTENQQEYVPISGIVAINGPNPQGGHSPDNEPKRKTPDRHGLSSDSIVRDIIDGKNFRDETAKNLDKVWPRLHLSGPLVKRAIDNIHVTLGDTHLQRNLPAMTQGMRIDEQRGGQPERREGPEHERPPAMTHNEVELARHGLLRITGHAEVQELKHGREAGAAFVNVLNEVNQIRTIQPTRSYDFGGRMLAGAHGALMGPLQSALGGIGLAHRRREGKQYTEATKVSANSKSEAEYVAFEGTTRITLTVHYNGAQVELPAVDVHGPILVPLRDTEPKAPTTSPAPPALGERPLPPIPEEPAADETPDTPAPTEVGERPLPPPPHQPTTNQTPNTPAPTEVGQRPLPPPPHQPTTNQTPHTAPTEVGERPLPPPPHQPTTNQTPNTPAPTEVGERPLPPVPEEPTTNETPNTPTPTEGVVPNLGSDDVGTQTHSEVSDTAPPRLVTPIPPVSAAEPPGAQPDGDSEPSRSGRLSDPDVEVRADAGPQPVPREARDSWNETPATNGAGDVHSEQREGGPGTQLVASHADVEAFNDHPVALEVSPDEGDDQNGAAWAVAHADLDRGGVAPETLVTQPPRADRDSAHDNHIG